MDPAEAIYQQAWMLQQPIQAAQALGDSEIQQFYSGKTVFLTGGTGFLGKLLIEKLIRSCNINKLYLLIREKKSKTAQERLRSLIKDSVFDELRAKNPNFAEKIIAVEGDVAEKQLGINDEVLYDLAEEVNIIFHVAGTTKFNECLKRATLINVRGTRETLLLARHCKQLSSYVYVSTAYSQAVRSRIGSEILEKFYPCPVPPNSLIELAENIENDRLIAATKNLTDGWPNTYTFTKAVAEELIRTKSDDMPVCIVKPPNVICAYKEPSPGWIDKSAMYGASGIFLSAMIGFLHAIWVINPRISLIPADYANNLIIAAGRETAMNHNEGDKRPKIYMHSSSKIPSIWDRIIKIIQSHDTGTLSTPKSFFYRFVIETPNKYVFWVLNWLLHYIPAYLADGVSQVLGLKKPLGIKSFVKQHAKLHETWMLLSYYANIEWNLSDDNTVDLYNRMSKTDKDLFNFDVMSINWDELITIWGLGMRKYIIKDGLKDTARGIRRQFWKKIETYVILAIYAYVIYKIFYLLFCLLVFCLKLF